MEYTSDLSDYHAADLHDDSISTDNRDVAVANRFNKVAALAYARWEALRGGTDLPSISHSHREKSRLFTPNCVQIAWDDDITMPTISYLGSELAEQLASLSGDAWPNLPIESPLVLLLRNISQRAIHQCEATEFDEKVVDSEGCIRDYQGLALPFAGDGPGTFLVDVIFDLDHPIPIVEEPAPKSGNTPGTDDVLLLEQELDPADMPRPATAPPPHPVLFVCVSDDQKPSRQPLAPEPAKSIPRLAPSRTLPKAVPAAEYTTSREAPEPLLLTEQLEVPSAVTAAPGEPSTSTASDKLLLSLEVARSEAAAARGSEERSHTALYKAISAAYDCALLAADAPERLEQLVLEAGLKVQARAPMTPIVKLIFGADYDRSRLAEYSSALTHAFRADLPAGSFANYLLTFDGGLKGLVKAERQLRRKSDPTRTSQLTKVEAKLRKAPVHAFDDFVPQGQEFALVIARRMPDGSVAMLGEVPPDDRLLCTAARKFLKK